MSDQIHYSLIDVPSKNYYDERSLRDRLLRQPLGLQLTTSDTEHDHEHIHIGAFLQTKLIGCVIAAPVANTTGTFRIRQMAVQENIQGKGVGRGLILKAEQAIQNTQGQHVILDARVSAQGFYLSLGYQLIGDEFIHNTIPHILMEKHLI